MAKNEIRVQYSGFVIFAAKLLSVATGLAFQYMIARSTNPSEYGVWFNINDVLAYCTILAGIIPFWIMRFAARQEKGAIKTGIVANLAISIAAASIYLPLVPLIATALDVQNYISLYILVSIQIVELHLLNAFEACLRAKKPQTLGYGLLISEACKVFLGYILIIRLQKPLEGAIISITTAVATQLIFYLKLLAEDLKQSVKWAYVKEWVKGSVANIYNVLGHQIAAYIFIMLFTYGGEAARSNYGAAFQIANIITYSSFLAFALYPKLLAEKTSQDITTSIKTVLMFAIPMTAGVLTLPELYLTILKEEYIKARLVLIVLAIDSLVVTISTLYSFVLYGYEKIDEEAKIPFKELVKSRLFIAFSLPYIHSTITIPLTYYALTTYTQNQPIQSALAVAIINSAARFAMFLILYAMVRKIVKMEIPWKNITKYVFASIIMSGILFFTKETLGLQPGKARVHQILGLTAVGGIFYFVLLYVIDADARMLVKAVWQEIKAKIDELKFTHRCSIIR
ncbi:MAG: oligosaccharide flippase family protein [Candidatus Bathyarchaeia archaeon]